MADANVPEGVGLQEIVELVKPVPVGAVVTGVAPATGVVTPVRVAPGFCCVAGKRTSRTPVLLLNALAVTPLIVKKEAVKPVNVNPLPAVRVIVAV